MMYDSRASLCEGSRFRILAIVRSWVSSKWCRTNRGWLAILRRFISIPTPDSFCLFTTNFFLPDAILRERATRHGRFFVSFHSTQFLTSAARFLYRATLSKYMVCWTWPMGTTSTLAVLAGRWVRTSDFNLRRKNGFIIRLACLIRSFSYEDRPPSSDFCTILDHHNFYNNSRIELV